MDFNQMIRMEHASRVGFACAEAAGHRRRARISNAAAIGGSVLLAACMALAAAALIGS